MSAAEALASLLAELPKEPSNLSNLLRHGVIFNGGNGVGVGKQGNAVEIGGDSRDSQLGNCVKKSLQHQ